MTGTIRDSRTSVDMPGGTVASSGSASQPDAVVAELLSYSLERLRKEPELLQAERAQLERSMQASALSHYHAFLDSAECMAVVRKQLIAAVEGLSALADSVPALGAALEAFSSDAAGVMAQHAAIKQLAGQQLPLSELLDAPSLMDTCVRSGAFDEALDLQAFVARLALLHPDVPLVKMLEAQAASVSQVMLAQLLQRLRGPVQLPECLRVVGHLRRMAAFPEPELRLQFLCCREDWLRQLVAELDDTEPLEHVKALVDVHRLHLFDVVMQFRAVFADHGGAQLAGSGSSADGGISSAKAGEGAALNSWVQHRLMHFVAALERRLPDVQDGASLASALEHCMYACSSLGRVGLDFGALLQPLFQDCAMRLFAARLVLAVDAFQARLDGHKWVEMPAPMFGRAKQQKPAGSSSSGGGDGGQPAQTTGDDDELAPPYELMEHVPLAVFANGALSALNELRHVALLPLASPAASALQASLERVAASLEHYRSTHSLSEQETRMFSAAARALPDVLARHLARALSALFPGAGAALRPAALVVPPDSGAL